MNQVHFPLAPRTDRCDAHQAILPDAPLGTRATRGADTTDRASSAGVRTADAHLRDSPVVGTQLFPTRRFAPSRRMPRESLDARENLPKERRCQVTFSQLEDEVPGMPDLPPSGLEESLLEAREGRWRRAGPAGAAELRITRVSSCGFEELTPALLSPHSGRSSGTLPRTTQNKCVPVVRLTVEPDEGLDRRSQSRSRGSAHLSHCLPCRIPRYHGPAPDPCTSMTPVPSSPARGRCR